MKLATFCQLVCNTAVTKEKQLSCVYYFPVTAVLCECFDLLQPSRSCVGHKGTSDDEETRVDGICGPPKVVASDVSAELVTGIMVRNLNMPAGMH